LVNIFLSSCNNAFNLNCTADDVIVLDASTDKKLSYHVIIKSVVFHNTTCCKAFVQHVLSNISGEGLQEISYIDMKGSVKYLIDMKVYSRNQNFRLIGSSKFGKNFPLKKGKASK